MSGINQHSVLGRIGKIETRYTPDGKPVVNMSLAVSENWTDKNSGQKQEKTDWINVVAFGKPAEIIGQYANKGDKIYIQGKVVTRKWQDASGNDRYSTETIVDGFNGKFELLGNKRDESNIGQANINQSPQQFQQQTNHNQQVKQPVNQQNNDADAFDAISDDIPFNLHERELLI